MTGLAKVRSLIARLSPEGICDECLAGLAELTKRSDAGNLARQFVGHGGYQRSRDQCCMCQQTRQVTRMLK